ncbi:peptidyl-prolyl cis-trans isomerase FKBP53-like [Cornus florida]|uniref:peptidyl-prolyl cis-trans isomerase FKBP53-like n=1 Tax=Cornus florida TaxID=4283 RepID=UPI00289DBA52|nr:peptidyl-prolyl cis-trans isomerase FKBP53-like [Cornus florida]
MAFWGIEIKSGSPYTHRFDENRGRLHVSQATLGSGSSARKSIVQCNVGDEKPIYLCSLLPERLETCALNLEFEESDEVIFSVIGPDSVHLSGFFLLGSQDSVTDDYDDLYAEDIADTETDESTDSSTDSTDYSTDSTEDDYGYHFFNDDVDMFPPSPVHNCGVVIEEILDDEKPATENHTSKRPKRKGQLSAFGDKGISQQQIVIGRGTSFPILESEDEDGFATSSPRKDKAKVMNTKGTKEKGKRKKAKDDSDRVKSLKRKVDAIIQDGEHARLTSQQFDSPLATTEVVPENDVKQKKKKKKKKTRGNEEKSRDSQTVEATTRDMDQAPPVGEHDEHQTIEKSCDTADENHSRGKKKKTTKKEKKTKKKKKIKPECKYGSH